jgi:ABC-type glycerol-3-phosphate transport system substrate-binding protein
VTWDDWAAAGKKLKEANADAYMGYAETTTQWITSR